MTDKSRHLIGRNHSELSSNYKIKLNHGTVSSLEFQKDDNFFVKYDKIFKFSHALRIKITKNIQFFYRK